MWFDVVTVKAIWVSLKGKRIEADTNTINKGKCNETGAIATGRII